MISTLELTQFRGFEHIRFENLGRANLIMGGNNTGKTSILEALVLLFGNQQQVSNLPVTFRRLPKEQNDPVAGFWSLLVKGTDTASVRVSADDVTLEGSIKGATSQLRRTGSNPKSHPVVSFGSDGSLAAHGNAEFLKLSVLSTAQKDPAEISELFNQIAPLNPENEARLESLLRKSIEPRLRRLRYAKPLGTKNHLVYVDLGEGAMLPFTQLGQAFSRALQVYCEIFASRPEILLIDEIENGLYHEGLDDYWRGLLEVLEDQNVQLFATTHSRECMEAAHRAAKERADYPLRYLRLDRHIDSPGRIVATTFAGEEMETAIHSNIEMR
jgi:hypothetical protein